MAKKTGYITEIVKGKERLSYYGPLTFTTTQVTRRKAKSSVKEINKRYGKGTAYFRKTSSGDKTDMWLPIWSVFFKR